MIFNLPEWRHIHFIGIGGIGMCGLAEVLLDHGYRVSGSDQINNAITQRLSRLGAQIIQGHSTIQVIQADVAVYSSAISADNPELLAAQKHGMLILRRGELLARLMVKARGVAIAGTHGKTTTTGMISHILADTKFDPIAINGGIVQGGDSTVRIGRGEYLIAEADESDVSFLLLQPEIAVITNIEADHLENYGGDFKQLQESFIEFANLLPAHGLLICGIDDPVVRELLPQFPANRITFGFAADADVRAINYQQAGLRGCFSLQGSGVYNETSWQLSLPGKHNVLNALAAIAVAQHLGVDSDILQTSLQLFPGMGRRFHFCGQLPVTDGNTLVYTDYGHHPSEIAATIAAARGVWPARRIVMVFQPHRYSRTQALLTQFIDVLVQADVILLLDIYAACEQAISEVNSEILCRLLQKNHDNVHYLPELKELPAVLQQIAQADDVIFLQGAGSIGVQAVELLQTDFI